MMSMTTISLNTSEFVTADGRKGQRAVEMFRAQYNKARLDHEGAQRLNEHPSFAAYLAEGIRRFSAKFTDYGLARSILGVDFITPEEVTKARPSIVYTPDQITALARGLPSEDVLRWCTENDYTVMPAPPTAMSTLDVRDIQSTHFYSKTGGWYSDQKFVREDKTSFGWLMIKRTSVTNSNSKTWGNQNLLLSRFETVPNAAEMCWFITTYFEVRGVRLFEGVYVRTSSLYSDGRIHVGDFVSDGLYVGYYWDDDLNEDMGLSAMRR